MIHTMSSGSGPVRVLINGNFETRDSTELLPGDVIEINVKQATLWCDCVVLTGSCAVSESMLTGTLCNNILNVAWDDFNRIVIANKITNTVALPSEISKLYSPYF